MYEQSESIDQITTALAAFHAELRNPAFDSTLKTNKWSSKFVSFANLLETYGPQLAKHGLVVKQFHLDTGTPDLVGCVTQIQHTSGQWQRCSGTMPVNGTAARSKDGEVILVNDRIVWLRTFQDTGAALSYLERYQYTTVIGVRGEEDDDGRGIDGTVTRDSKPQTREKAPSKAQERLEAAKAARAQAEPSATESAPSGPQGTCPEHGPFDGEGCPDCGLVEGEVAGDHATDREVFALIDRMEKIGMQKRQIAELLPGQPYHVEQDVFDLAVEAVQNAEKVAERRAKLPSEPAEGGDGAVSPAMQRLKEAQERRAAAKSRIRGQG